MGSPKDPDSRDSITRRTRASGSNRAFSPQESSDDDAFLVVIYGAELGRRVQLPKAVFEIGRSNKCELSLDEDAVSRHHCRILYVKEEGWVIHDAGSTNGVYVNDVKKKKATLYDGDQVRVGRTILKFMTGANIEAVYHDEVYRLMTVDGLTRAYNKRYFEEALEREVNRARRHKRALSLVLFDVDHFKTKNDTFGHVAGDSVLRQLAGFVSAKLRKEDIMARVGGEEFAVLLPEIASAGARVTAEKIRRIVEGAPINVEAGPVPCTVSVGFATFDPSMRQPGALFKAADVALYKAKNAGRNCVVG